MPGGTAKFHANDMIARLTQTTPAAGSNPASTTTMDYDLDPAGRINHITTSQNSSQVGQTRYRFPSNGDAPAIVEVTTPEASGTWAATRYLNLPGLGMAASLTNGTTTLQLANLHGDIIATAPVGDATIAGYAETDEYGNQIEAEAQADSRYGWLGANQRSTETPAGDLTLMGARVYDPDTGLFLSPDPVLGGNTTPYTYPQDPLDGFDLDGNRRDYATGGAGGIGGVGGMAGPIAAVATIAGIKIISESTLYVGGFVIPMPNMKHKNDKWKKFRVYMMRFWRGGRWRVWKYGMTGLRGDYRPNRQKPRCTRWSGSSKGCTHIWMANGKHFNWYEARLIEGNLIGNYALLYGKCPPGHNGRICT